MELQLGLALVPPHRTPIRGFDLNTTWLEQEDQNINGYAMEKRDKQSKASSFCCGGEAFEHGDTFPLVSWNGGLPNEDDDGRRDKEKTSDTNDNDDDDDGTEISDVVGWPPIKSWRKKMLHGHDQVGRIRDHRMAMAAAAERGAATSTFRSTNSSSSMYVKVKMEGVGITRKIDLKLYRSYHTLTRNLINMFTKYEQIEKASACYTLLYQDNEGDWLLAGDVPWETFIESVQRMEILRNAG